MMTPGRIVTALSVGLCLAFGSTACGDPIAASRSWTGNASYRVTDAPDPSYVGTPLYASGYRIIELSGVIDGQPHSAFRAKCYYHTMPRNVPLPGSGCGLVLVVDGKLFGAVGDPATGNQNPIYQTYRSTATPGATIHIYNRGYPHTPGPNRVEIVMTPPGH